MVRRVRTSLDPILVINARLTKLREGLGYTSKTKWCELLDIEKQNWSPHEIGSGSPRRITLDTAARIVDATGVTLDYIYYGRISNDMPSRLDTILRGIEGFIRDERSNLQD